MAAETVPDPSVTGVRPVDTFRCFYRAPASRPTTRPLFSLPHRPPVAPKRLWHSRVTLSSVRWLPPGCGYAVQPTSVEVQPVMMPPPSPAALPGRSHRNWRSCTYGATIQSTWPLFPTALSGVEPVNCLMHPRAALAATAIAMVPHGQGVWVQQAHDRRDARDDARRAVENVDVLL